jgi:hypothetical protein
MNDIVERLRETIVAYDTWYQGQLKTSDTLLERFSCERHEAADEITHLRAELKQADELMFNQAQRISELTERTEQLGFFQIKINDRIYFVSEGVGKEIEKLRDALKKIELLWFNDESGSRNSYDAHLIARAALNSDTIQESSDERPNGKI